jgi:hypothetical protein
MTSTFGERFQAARDFQAASGRREKDGEFADAIGVSGGLVSAFKGAKEPPPTDRVLAIAKRCGVDPGWLAFGNGSHAPAPDGFEVWLENFRAKPKKPTVRRRRERRQQPAAKRGVQAKVAGSIGRKDR